MRALITLPVICADAGRKDSARARRAVQILFIHNGTPEGSHLEHLIDAGLDVSDVHADTEPEKAAALQPDIIVLDYSDDSNVLEALKHNPATNDIPIIALVELLKTH